MAPLIVSVAFAPGLFWLWYFYKKDKWRPEPKRLVVRTFVWGMVATLPALFAEVPFGRDEFIVAVLAAPVVEELLKFLVVRFTIYNDPEFDEPMDGIVYSAAAALGFASLENANYLLNAYRSPDGGELANVFVIRAILSVPGHVLFSSVWGYALGRAKFASDEARTPLLFKAIATSVGLHAAFNFLLIVLPFGSAALILFVASLWKSVRKRIDNALGIRQLLNLPIPTRTEGRRNHHREPAGLWSQE